ncbi:hypothetical protein [Chitinophaga arvensicola]|uniref:Uncharacterized protein n=1 Tax=Chitinophaga arvensicola TaxID=29529 RepID=A0A1I0S9Q1_9BACT|nr:hypothetical protein [Chitinophaga arvensicola]SEW52926.1 hypothetical protein SAMN04488122_5241 [Chitinophaga arvensicola]
MKHRKAELDVDFIGGLGSLTKEDEKAISDFIKARKQSKERIRSTTLPKKDRKAIGSNARP